MVMPEVGTTVEVHLFNGQWVKQVVDDVIDGAVLVNAIRYPAGEWRHFERKNPVLEEVWKCRDAGNGVHLWVMGDKPSVRDNRCARDLAVGANIANTVRVLAQDYPPGTKLVITVRTEAPE